MIRFLTEDDLPQLFAIRQVAYLDTSDYSTPEARQRHVDRLPYTRGFFDGDTLTSAAIVYPFEIFFAGQPVPMGGLASVLSAPEYRRRGHVEALLKDALSNLRAQGVGWCVEYPFDPRYYARYGWGSVPSGFVVTCPSDKLFGGRAQGAKRLTKDELGRLEPTYARWAAGYNFTRKRGERVHGSWSNILFRAWETRERFIYKLDGAYCVLSLTFNDAADMMTLTVKDYAYSSPEGRSHLWRFIGSFYGQADRVRLHLPGDEPLLFDLQGYVEANRSSFQARVVDVTRALSGLSCETALDFTLGVRDDFCEWNDGVFRLELSPNGVQVEKVGAAKNADVSLDVRALPLLLSGGVNARTAQRIGLAEGDLKYLEALTTLAGGRVPYMAKADYF